MVWCATSAHLFGWMLPISCTDLVCSWIIKLIWMSVKWDCSFLLKLFCVAHPERTFIWLLLKFFASVRGFIQLIPLDHSKIKSPKWGIALIYIALSNKVFLVLLGFVLRKKNPNQPINIPERIMKWIRKNVYLKYTQDKCHALVWQALLLEEN